MTQKDYIKLANVMLSQKPITTFKYSLNGVTAFGQWLNIVTSLSTTLALDNPRFKHDLFMTACGVGK